MRRIILAFLFCGLAGMASAQITYTKAAGGGGAGTTDPSDFSSPDGSIAIGGSIGSVTMQCDGTVCVFYSTGTSDPASCTQGGMFHYRTDSSLLKICSATDTWTQVVTVDNADASGFGFVIDDDSMATASATTVPTSESVKAYVDANAGSFNPGSAIEIYDEFLGGNTTARTIGQVGFYGLAIGGGAGTYVDTAPAGHPGLFRLASASATDNSGFYLTLGASTSPHTSFGASWGTTNWTLDFDIIVGSASSAITNAVWKIGVTDSATFDGGALGIFVRYDPDMSDSKFMFVVCNASGAAGCNSAADAANAKVEASTVTPVAGTAYRGRIVHEATGGPGSSRKISFRINDETAITFCSSTCTDTLGTVPATSGVMTVTAAYGERATGAVLSGDLDYIYLTMTGLSRY